MKKIIIACLLATSAASTFAEWTAFFETGTSTFYIDYESIRKEGSNRKFWYLSNAKQRQNDDEGMSRLVRPEVDCKEERYRLLSNAVYSESMAGGQVLFNRSSLGPWAEIPPGTAVASMLKIVCAK